MFHRLAARMNHALTLAPDASLHEDITKFFRRNFLVNILDMMSWVAGASFVAPTTILPVYASHLTDSAILIGLIPGLMEFGMFAPPLLVAPYVERVRRKYPLVIGFGIVERFPYLLLPFAVLWFDRLPSDWAIWALLGFVGWMALGTGLVITPWQEMLAKLIPTSHRGRLFGTGFFLGRLAGIIMTPVVAAILAYFAYPTNYAVSFGVGCIGIWGSLFFLSFTREPSVEPQQSPENANRKYVHRLWYVLSKHRNFRYYLLSRWLIQMGRMPLGFMTLYAVQRFGFPDESSAIFSGVLYATGMLGFAIWGNLGDRWGHKRVLVIATSLWLIALLIAQVAVYWTGALYLAFAVLGLGDSGQMMSNLNLPLELGSEADRPMIISLTRTMIGPILLVVPMLGGWLIEVSGYGSLFAIALILTVAALALLIFVVEEPRNLQKHS